MLSSVQFTLISEKSQEENQTEIKYPIILFDVLVLIQVLGRLVAPFIETVSSFIPTSLFFALLFIYFKGK